MPGVQFTGAQATPAGSIKIEDFSFDGSPIGPTSSNGYYTTGNLVNGGWVIYLNKVSGGPSVYEPANDAQLIAITNKISGLQFTTVQECINYFADADGAVLVGREIPNVVTDGLQLYLDAGILQSYPQNGSTWLDLSGNRQDATLVGGVTYDQSGCLSFDGGSGSYCQIPAQVVSSEASTIHIIYKKQIDSGGLLWSQNYFDHMSVINNGIYGETNSNCNYFSSPTFTQNLNTWYQHTIVFDTFSAYHYSNGAFVGQTLDYGSVNCGNATIQLVADWTFTRIGNATQYEPNFNGEIMAVLRYDKVLSEDELQQNTEAFAPRLV